MDIPMRVDINDEGPWWYIFDGIPYIGDAPCGHNITLFNYTVEVDGQVHPSIICHNEYADKKIAKCVICTKQVCGWHKTVKLIGWNKGKYVPTDVGHTYTNPGFKPTVDGGE